MDLESGSAHGPVHVPSGSSAGTAKRSNASNRGSGFNDFGRFGETSAAPAAAEERQQQEEDVEDVEEDRGREQRGCLDLVGAAQALEVVHRVAGEDHETEHRVDHVAAGIETNISTIPNTISPSSAKKATRAIFERYDVAFFALLTG